MSARDDIKAALAWKRALYDYTWNNCTHNDGRGHQDWVKCWRCAYEFTHRALATPSPETGTAAGPGSLWTTPAQPGAAGIEVDESIEGKARTRKPETRAPLDIARELRKFAPDLRCGAVATHLTGNKYCHRGQFERLLAELRRSLRDARGKR